MREGLLVTLFLLALTPQLGVSESFLKARLDKAVERSITSHSELTGYDLTIDARHGRVTLSGSVPSQEVGQRIVQIAQETNGVSSVDNQLVVVSREVTTLKESNSPLICIQKVSPGPTALSKSNSGKYSKSKDLKIQWMLESKTDLSSSQEIYQLFVRLMNSFQTFLWFGE